MAKIISFPGGEDITPPKPDVVTLGKGTLRIGDREYPVESFTVERPKITNRIVDIEARGSGTFTVDAQTLMGWLGEPRADYIPYHEWIEPTIDPTVSKWRDEPLWLKEIPYRGNPADLGTRYHKALEHEIERTWEDWSILAPRYDVIDEPEPEVTSKFDLSAFNLPPKANLPIGKNTPQWAKDKHQREERSKTYLGIAEAAAQQWGDVLLAYKWDLENS